MDNAPSAPKPISLHLLKEITNNFSMERKLGGGSYGDVYLGVSKNGEKIAVKVLKDGQDLDDKQYEKEYRNLASLDHKNIVRLVGYCHETMNEFIQHEGRTIFAEKSKKMLCFEYMHNKGLDKFISDESNGQNWHTRYAIIKGICEGLEYIHEKLESPMYHLDLKPANILLDENMTPKIADFGLARLFLEEKTKVTKSDIGTPGYRPPEYIDKHEISIKFDIFSLGVVMIEIMAGRDGYFRSAEVSPHQFVERVHTEWMNRLQVTSMSTYSMQVKRCIEIALRCVQKNPHNRPSIGVIVNNVNQNTILDELRNGSESPIDEDHQSGSKPSLPLQYLKDITNNFCDERVLGKGGIGVVYKGMLQDGKMIAVKKILQAIPSSQKQFENEVNLLMKLEHKNIVRLVGYCYETRQPLTDYKGKSILAWNTESLLCLEYMPNGSLHKYITDASSGLTWDTRYKIIEGISYGLLYLHEHSNVPIIHLDLKPDNILLDENMCPKVTDFGLSRLFPRTSGTFGYISQEVLKGVISPMADIFSLGVIILEVITGHRDYPYDIRIDSKGFIELELQRWRNRIQKEPGYRSLETDCQQIERCIQIGLICVNPKRTKRPTIKKVIDMLQDF